MPTGIQAPLDKGAQGVYANCTHTGELQVMAREIRLRALGVCVAVALGIAGAVGVAVPAMAHSNNCTIGNSNQVVIVFQHAYQEGTKDDLCWKDGYSKDDEFSVDESGVDDVGENLNFHDQVSSLSVKNLSSTNDLCVKLYIDACQSVLGDKVWVPADFGDFHVDQVEDNDQYDSMDLTRQDQESCGA